MLAHMGPPHLISGKITPMPTPLRYLRLRREQHFGPYQMRLLSLSTALSYRQKKKKGRRVKW